MRRKKRKLRVSFDLKLNLTRISCVKFDDPSNLMTLEEMVLYFSATGNTQYAAQQIAKATGDTIVSKRNHIEDEHP